MRLKSARLYAFFEKNTHNERLLRYTSINGFLIYAKVNCGSRFLVCLASISLSAFLISSESFGNTTSTKEALRLCLASISLSAFFLSTDL